MASTSGGSQDKRNWKLLVDPCLKKGLPKLYRFDGICQGSRNAAYNIVLPSDPRTHIPRFYARSEPMDLSLPSFKIDDNYVGKPPQREISFFGLNDNINGTFLKDLCTKCGDVDDAKIFYHPKTNRHLGLAFVIFKKIRAAKVCLERYNRSSVMGKRIEVILDPFGKIVKKAFRQLSGPREKREESLDTPSPTAGSAAGTSQPPASADGPTTIGPPNSLPPFQPSVNTPIHVPTPPQPPQLIPEDPLIIDNLPVAPPEPGQFGFPQCGPPPRPSDPPFPAWDGQPRWPQPQGQNWPIHQPPLPQPLIGPNFAYERREPEHQMFERRNPEHQMTERRKPEYQMIERRKSDYQIYERNKAEHRGFIGGRESNWERDKPHVKDRGERSAAPPRGSGGKNYSAYEDVRRQMANLFKTEEDEFRGERRRRRGEPGQEREERRRIEGRRERRREEEESSDNSSQDRDRRDRRRHKHKKKSREYREDRYRRKKTEKRGDSQPEPQSSNPNLEDGECEEELEESSVSRRISGGLEAISSDSEEKEEEEEKKYSRKHRKTERNRSGKDYAGRSGSGSHSRSYSRDNDRAYRRGYTARHRRSRSYSDESVDSISGDRKDKRGRSRRERSKSRDTYSGGERWGSSSRSRASQNRRREVVASSSDENNAEGERRVSKNPPKPKDSEAEVTEHSLESRIQHILHGAQKEVIKVVTGKEGESGAVQEEAGIEMDTVSQDFISTTAPKPTSRWNPVIACPVPPMPPAVDPVAYHQQMMHLMQMGMLGPQFSPFPPMAPTAPRPPMAPPAWGRGSVLPNMVLPPPPFVPVLQLMTEDSRTPLTPSEENGTEEKVNGEQRTPTELERGLRIARNSTDVVVRELKSVLRKDLHRRMLDGSTYSILDSWWESSSGWDASKVLQTEKQKEESRSATEQKQAAEMAALVAAPISSAIAELFGTKAEGSEGFGGLPGFGLRASMPHFKVPKKKPTEEEETATVKEETAVKAESESSDDEGPVSRRRISSSSSQSESEAEEICPSESRQKSPDRSVVKVEENIWTERAKEAKEGSPEGTKSESDGKTGQEEGSSDEEEESSGVESDSEESDSESSEEEEEEDESDSSESESSTLDSDQEEERASTSRGSPKDVSKNELEDISLKKQAATEGADSEPILQKLAVRETPTTPAMPQTEKQEVEGVMVLSGSYSPWAYDHFYMFPPSKWPKKSLVTPLAHVQFDFLQKSGVRRVGVGGKQVKKVVEPLPVFKKRPVELERDNIYAFLKDGLDSEDAQYLNEGFEWLKNESADKFPWVKDVHWIPHPVAAKEEEPKKKRMRFSVTEEELQKQHKTGSARTEGYYKITHKEKRSFMRRAAHAFDRTAEQYIQDVYAAKQAAQLGREARAQQRRILTQLGAEVESSDLLKINQLKFRKKLVKFGRSRIHGWGLFALENIQPDEMIVEYIGQKIRFNVAERREADYEKKGIGSSYLFRIDTDQVIDATKTGNLARFINHSCSPSCYAKIITVDGEKRIVIYSKEVIRAGDEITYDYKFPLEDEKIPCLCGAPHCRGSLN